MYIWITEGYYNEIRGGEKHMGVINCTFGRGRVQLIIKVKIEEGVIDKKEKIQRVIIPKYWEEGG